MFDIEVRVRYTLSASQTACTILCALSRDNDLIGNPYEWSRADVVRLLRKELTDHGITCVWDSGHEYGPAALVLASKLGFDENYLDGLFSAIL